MTELKRCRCGGEVLHIIKNHEESIIKCMKCGEITDIEKLWNRVMGDDSDIKLGDTSPASTATPSGISAETVERVQNAIVNSEYGQDAQAAIQALLASGEVVLAKKQTQTEDGATK